MIVGSILLYVIGPSMGSYFDIGYFKIFTLEYCFYTFCILLLVILFLVIINCGFAYRLSLLELLNVSKDLKVESKTSSKFAFLSIPLYLFSIYMLITSKTRIIYDSSTNVMLGIDPSVLYFFGMLATLGILFMVMRYIPNFLLKMQKQKALRYKRFMIASGNVIVDLKASKLLVLMIMSSSLIFTCLIGIFYQDTIKLNFLLISSALLMLINIFGVVYVMLISFQQKKHSFYQLQTLGYLGKDLKSIIKIEVLFYFGILTLLPISIIGCFLYKFIEIHLLSVSFALSYLTIYVIANMIGAIMVISAYYHIMKKENN